MPSILMIWIRLSGDYGKVSCPSSESNSGLDADDTETSPDAEGSGYFVSREPGSFGSGKAASRSCLGCFESLLAGLLCSKLISYLEKKSFCSFPVQFGLSIILRNRHSPC